ncbi:MAG TPA: cytochrome c-type biogenesis protein CcmH [Acidobacteriaceae bacterium]|nr:cytochrome c-type biogenesis protein CcmH [Acidobacteriaceae bacterium]
MPERQTTSPATPRSPIFYARTIQILLLAIVTFTMIAATRSQYDRIGHELTCSCGCGEILAECNHVHCSYQPQMLGELRTQISTGASDQTILDWFVAKYGPIILAAPIRTGFDRVAWIVPITVFMLATIGTFAVVSLWRRRAARFASPDAIVPDLQPTTPQQSSLRDRIRQETEY